MVSDNSDEMLRRILFGRGSSPEQIRAASEELQRRSIDTVAPAQEHITDTTPANVSEVDSTGDPAVAPTFRVQRGNRLRLVATLAIGCGIGIAGTVGFYQAGNQGHANGNGLGGNMSSTTTSVVDTGSNETLYQVPGSETAADPARVDRWFARQQTGQDALPIELEDIEPASSRYVGRIGTNAGAWIARNLDGDYCAIIALDDGATSASSCAPPGAFLRTGTSVGTNGNTMFWTPSTVILSVTPR
ncbi:hypothetical protein [Planctomonas deserti]|uniref:hypothetical protein n=1 Tax=Planctomonas deserti TaxID=2144185 RepID=UPI000D39AAEC|nr:hypothetical protein [Planctomonas deserti]